MRSTSLTEAFPAHTPAASQIFTTVLSHGPLTRSEIAGRTQLSAAAVTKAVRPLIEAGYLVEDVAEDARQPVLGRPANPVRVDGGRALFLGIKVTGDELIAVLTDLCCRIRVARRVPLTSREPKAVLTSVAGLVQELLTEADGFGVQVRGLGIAVSGDVDRAAGVVRYSPFLEWRDVPLAELAATTTGLPVTLDNDVRALTVAEQWFGAGVGLSDFALVTVGAGIGCGLVVHGQVVAGAHGVAGEIGHVAIDPAGPRCHCGNRGCVEAIASDPAIVGRIREVTGASVADATAALALAHDGDPGAREVYARAGAAIGRGIATVANLLGPERVIISGEGLAAYDLFAEQIRDAFAAAAFGSAADCDVQTRPLPFEEWARGAAATAIQSFTTSDAR
ncbi:MULTISPECIES: ROK family transcriptional regulator [Streptomyces]|jgi:predicted NBD/HSP70 family sugar kinase|uniref:Sugar kinase n=1 Tax=Streptomyces olivochromogenes TaxID=1963 RepID=A0A250VJX3_STROL|nr:MULTISPECIES: ROK family transcriptional regulator [Streptomyces]KUN42662.1 ROK family transcriptional regulator [Streptomyces olivochromogenes]MCT9112487.1 ROK family transcriptional regulator [Streptomyces mirabilis]MCX4431146.1 ROK family transcriptional regulator [Streptomyces mirabilis]SOE78746.1 Sugar kinase of the NBD/HSP70 family, may contain an N-terminal HTH domain [Streptomyces sp. OV198]GAX54369.1 sugar kinase [Streptomyces olivochromogenes]